MKRQSPPIVGVACCRRYMGSTAGHIVFEQYTAALTRVGLVPVLLPAVGGELTDPTWPAALLARLDGLFLPGSPSNVHPAHYGGTESSEMEVDPARDATTLPLIRRAVMVGAPLLAVCRGFQELNVALGGVLTADVDSSEGCVSHRAKQEVPRAERYEQAHALTLYSGGRLHARLGESTVRVNSLHRQGVAVLAQDLYPEAWAPDGLIEAASHVDANRFVVGVQWHPEWRRSSSGLDEMIFDEFAAACRRFATRGAAVDGGAATLTQ